MGARGRPGLPGGQVIFSCDYYNPIIEFTNERFEKVPRGMNYKAALLIPQRNILRVEGTPSWSLRCLIKTIYINIINYICIRSWQFSKKISDAKLVSDIFYIRSCQISN